MNSKNTWLTSDLHFGHRKMFEIRSEKRTFANIDEMDSVLIEMINNNAKENDTLIIIGDLSFRSIDPTIELLRRINCRNILLRPGNHDKQMMKPSGRARLCSALPRLRITDNDLCIPVFHNNQREHIVLSHFPFEIWDRNHYGSYHFHGHCHGRLPQRNIRRMDVGVDTIPTFEPYLLANAIEFLNQLEQS